MTAPESALARLLSELGGDRAALEKRFGEVSTWLARLSSAPAASAPVPPLVPPEVLAVIALSSEWYYSALEKIGERILRVFDGAIPSGVDWHRELLRTMYLAVEGVRPEILPPDTAVDARSLLGFRHFLRHAYAVDLDQAQVRKHAEEILRLHPRVCEALDRFTEFVRATKENLASAG